MVTKFQIGRQATIDLLTKALWADFPQHKLADLKDTSFVMRNYVEALSDDDIEEILTELQCGAFVRWRAWATSDDKWAWKHEFYDPSRR